MEKPRFVFGDEKKFLDFVSSLDGESRIALISHTDLDGIASAKVVGSVFNFEEILFCGYDDLNKNLVDGLKEKGINTLIITDLGMRKEFVELLGDFRVLVVDHHPSEEDFNSENFVFMNTKGFCATYFAHYLFLKVKDIEFLDWLVAAACIADWTYFENQEWMKEVFEKYGDKFEIEENIIRKGGKFWDLQWKLNLGLIYFRDDLKKVYDLIGKDFGDVGDLGKYVDEVQKEIDEAFMRFEKEKEKFGEVTFWEFSPKFSIGAIVANSLSVKAGGTLIIGKESGEFYRFSARRQDKKEDMGQLLKKLVEGFEGANAGGHVAAAGGSILLKDKEEFKRRLKEMFC